MNKEKNIGVKFLKSEAPSTDSYFSPSASFNVTAVHKRTAAADWTVFCLTSAESIYFLPFFPFFFLFLLSCLVLIASEAAWSSLPIFVSQKGASERVVVGRECHRNFLPTRRSVFSCSDSLFSLSSQ